MEWRKESPGQDYRYQDGSELIPNEIHSLQDYYLSVTPSPDSLVIVALRSQTIIIKTKTGISFYLA